MYKAYDADNSGVISADELPKAFTAAGEIYFISVVLNVCTATEKMEEKQKFSNSSYNSQYRKNR